MITPASLPDDAALLKSLLLAERTESERLRQIIKELQRHRFGPRAESLPVDQLLLGLEEVEQVEAASQAAEEAAKPVEREARAAKRRGNRGALPAHLPRIESVIDIENRTCPCCSGVLHRIGEACPRARPGGRRTARRRAGCVPGAGRASAEVCLPVL